MFKKSSFIRILAIASLLLVNLQWGIVSASPVDSEIQSVILYVKPGADGDCLSWDTACELQTALFNVTDGDQIWVAAGTYTPTHSTERTATFHLKTGVAIYGGFPSNGGGWETRNSEINSTTLSGDIGTAGSITDNSYNVVIASGVDGTAILDGFTITSGNADGLYSSEKHGGGMYNDKGSPTLTDITFFANTAYNGGGLANLGGSSPILTNVNFTGNVVFTFGGGMFNITNSNPILNNVTFTNNTAYYGGGMYNESSCPELTIVTFNNNTSTIGGGGMYNMSSSSPTLNNVTFNNNSSDRGGGMINNQSSPTLTNVTFNANTADSGGGMYNASGSNPVLFDVTFFGNTVTSNGGGMYNGNSSSRLTNVTFSENSASGEGGGFYNYGGIITNLTSVTFSGNTANNGGGMLNTNVSNPSLDNVTFSGNTAYNGGGLLNNSDSNPILTNVTFSGNNASYGGGMYNSYSSNPTLANVTFSVNTAAQGGGIYNFSSIPSLINSILWGNMPDQLRNDYMGSATITYSDIQGGYIGTGNIDADPLLGVLMDNGGFTRTIALGAGSPAIDAGNPELCPDFDQRGVARPIDGDGDGTAICDMGAYEYVPISFSFYIYLPLILKN